MKNNGYWQNEKEHKPTHSYMNTVWSEQKLVGCEMNTKEKGIESMSQGPSPGTGQIGRITH